MCKKKKVGTLILVFMISCFMGCKKEKDSFGKSLPEVSQQESVTIKEKSQLATFTYLREFKPHNISSGFGADILVNEQLPEKELVSLIVHLAGSHDPVLIRVYTSQIAYSQEQDGNYGIEYDKGYILFYVKNLSGSGPYQGCNEIRWMQASGKFGSKLGTKTKL